MGGICTHKEILLQLSKLEKEVKDNSKDIENIFMVLKELIEKPLGLQISTLIDFFGNGLRNKLALTIAAVIRNEEPYNENYIYQSNFEKP